MWFEDVMLLLLLVSCTFLIGLPIYKFVKMVKPSKRNALAEAKERLEQARVEIEAARLNKETEKLYDSMYQESLENEEEIQQEKHK